uniref:NPH3 domain-containing protein n=1 Tax=Leersia perrieri TaxID=77586 RepID=A0A0D9X013_9ORYZ
MQCAKWKRQREIKTPALHIPQSSPASSPLAVWQRLSVAQDPPTSLAGPSLSSPKASVSCNPIAAIDHSSEKLPRHLAIWKLGLSLWIRGGAIPLYYCFHPHHCSLFFLLCHVALKLVVVARANKKMGCVLEVDVDGEEVFLVDKEVLAPFCGRIKNLAAGGEGLAGAAAAPARRVVLLGFPGGAEVFELVARFCYTGGRGGGVEVTASNACALRCAAEFMDMAAAPSLVKMTNKVLDEMPQWPWHSVVDALKQCQRVLPIAESTGVFDKVLAALASHVSVSVLPGGGAGDATPTSSSPESSSAFRFSCDTKSSCLSTTTTRCRASWWHDDLAAVLSPFALERVTGAILARDHHDGGAAVSRFLFYYLKSRAVAGVAAAEKRSMIESTIAAMSTLDRSSLSCKGLFGILRISSPLKLAAARHDALVGMIGAKLDHATLDNLLVPAPPGATGGMYDVALVVRFVDAFLAVAAAAGGEAARVRKVGKLIDLYLAEVAPDTSLPPARFAELATALPAAARECHDALYRAIDVYFQVHTRVTEEEKMRICKGINYEKLSPECCKHLARNAGFPTRAAVQALASQHTVLKTLLRGDHHHLKPLSSSLPPATAKHAGVGGGEDDDDDLAGGGAGQVVLYARRLEMSIESQNLRSLLDGMHWRVMELEKVCSRMKSQMGKMKAARRGGGGGGRASSRSLPRMCS